MFLMHYIIALAPHIFLANVNAEWIEPHAWGRVELQKGQTELTGSELCPHCPKCEHINHETPIPMLDASTIEENVSFIYYRKFISSLFGRKNLNFDGASGLYRRALVFTITEDQLQLLEHSSDPRDWDGVLSQLMQNLKLPPICTKSSPSFFSSINSSWIKFSLSSEVNFILIALAAICAAIYLHKRYNYGIMLIFIVGVFSVGFIHTYLDCNRKLQIEEMAELLYSSDDPCAEGEPSKGWWGFFNFFSIRQSKSQCMEHLKKKHRVKLAYCRPDEVFLSYINEITLNQFRMTIEKSTEILKVCMEMYPFPYNILALIIFGTTLTTFLSLTFKYIISPKVWLRYAGSNTSKVKESDESGRDRISGENLKILLDTFRSISRSDVLHTNQENPGVSGVEILESIESNEENKLPGKEEHSEEQHSESSQAEIIINSDSNKIEKLKKQ